MKRPLKAQSKPYAIRVYITDHKDVKPTLKKLGMAAKKEGRSVSRFVLLAAVEKADAVLGGAQ